MTLEQWAIRWSLPPQALQEFQEITASSSSPLDERSEAFVASTCRLALTPYRVISMRNNVGVLEDKNGRPVRYGLCNETKAMNQAMKSSDDICILPYVVKPTDIGRKLGIFLGIEHKKPNWVYSGEGRELPQLNFQRMVRAAGGVALFANSAQGLIDNLVSEGLISR